MKRKIIITLIVSLIIALPFVFILWPHEACNRLALFSKGGLEYNFGGTIRQLKLMDTKVKDVEPIDAYPLTEYYCPGKYGLKIIYQGKNIREDTDKFLRENLNAVIYKVEHLD